MTAMPRNNLQRNADYWAQRMKNMEDALLDQSYSYVENLDAQFRAAEAEIERQMSAWYRRFAANNDITLQMPSGCSTVMSWRSFAGPWRNTSSTARKTPSPGPG